MKNPGGEIVQVQGGHIVRSTGRKDRHSKVFTAKGPRDRRVRLSAHTAIQFYDVQDRLGYDRPSKAVDWLIKNAKSAIDKLEQLPPWHPTDPGPDAQPDPAVPGSGNLDPDPPGGYGFHLGEASESHQNFPNYPQDNLGLSLYGGGGDQAPQAEQALFGFGTGSYQRMVAWHGQDVDGTAAFGGSNQRGTLQSSSSFSQMIRAWDDLPASVAAQRSQQQQQQMQIQQQPSIFGTRFVSDGGGGFPVFCVPARIHGEDDGGGGEGGHGVVYGRPHSPSSPNSAHP